MSRDITARPRQDSNLRTRLRRPMLYPLSYEGFPHILGGVSLDILVQRERGVMTNRRGEKQSRTRRLHAVGRLDPEEAET